jgi:RecJ-like exonuclease
MKYAICPTCDGAGMVAPKFRSTFHNPAIDDEVMCPECRGCGTVQEHDGALALSPGTADRMNALVRDPSLLGRELQQQFDAIFRGKS